MDGEGFGTNGNGRDGKISLAPVSVAEVGLATLA